MFTGKFYYHQRLLLYDMQQLRGKLASDEKVQVQQCVGFEW